MKRNVLIAFCVISVAPFCGQKAALAQRAAAKSAEMFTRFYDVSHLVVAKPQYPYTGTLPASSGSTNVNPVFGGGLGGLGGGAGGGGGFGGGMSDGSGGGLFSVPAGMQLGGLGGLGGQPGGGFIGSESGMANPAAAAADHLFLQHSVSDIADLLERNIDPDSWGIGDYPASMTALGNTLLVRQTDANHDAIGQFLRQLTAAVVGVDVYEVEVWWVPATAEVSRELDELLAAKTDLPLTITELSSVCEQASGFHGRLQCRERMTGHLTSGQRRPIIVGTVPVVGGQASGSQPVVRQVNIGLMLEATVIPVPDYMREGGGSDSVPDLVHLNLRSAITHMDSPANVATVVGVIDRFEMGANVLESGFRLEVGRPALVGTLTSVQNDHTDNTDQYEAAVVVVIHRR